MRITEARRERTQVSDDKHVPVDGNRCGGGISLEMPEIRPIFCRESAGKGLVASSNSDVSSVTQRKGAGKTL